MKNTTGQILQKTLSSSNIKDLYNYVSHYGHTQIKHTLTHNNFS